MTARQRAIEKRKPRLSERGLQKHFTSRDTDLANREHSWKRRSALYAMSEPGNVRHPSDIYMGHQQSFFRR